MRSERGVAVGTLTHMPPEQFIDAGLCDERSDIYSFGVVLFEMVTGLVPFLAAPPRRDCQDDVERFMSDMHRLHCDATPPSVGPPLGAVIGTCLQKYPGLRYQTFRDLRNELEGVFRAHSGQTPPIPKSGEMGATEWNNRGLSLQAMGRTDEALDCFIRSLEFDSCSADAWSNKGIALELLGRFDEALHCYDKAFAIDPTDSSYWNNKAACLLRLGKLKEALGCSETALLLNPNNAPAWINHGLILRRLGRPSDSIDSFTRALSLDRKEPRAWANLALALQDTDRFEEAIEALSKALEVDPMNAITWAGKGWVLGRVGRFHEGLECVRKAIELDANYCFAWFAKAACEDALSDFMAAVDSFQRYLALPGEKDPGRNDYAIRRLRELKSAN